MIKTKKNCSVCIAILEQPKKWEGRLAQRIYGSRYYMPSSDYRLSDVHREYQDKFSYESLLNHAKKHQALSEADYNDRQLRVTVNATEKAVLKQAIKSTQVWDEVITKGMEDLHSGNIQLNATHLLAAARDKSNFELKHAGQQIALMDMVFGFASGEKQPEGVRRDNDGYIDGETVPAAGAPGSDQSREVRSRAFYESLTGDAAPSGAD